jgi:hypothetical protein
MNILQKIYFWFVKNIVAKLLSKPMRINAYNDNHKEVLENIIPVLKRELGQDAVTLEDKHIRYYVLSDSFIIKAQLNITTRIANYLTFEIVWSVPTAIPLLTFVVTRVNGEPAYQFIDHNARWNLNDFALQYEIRLEKHLETKITL